MKPIERLLTEYQDSHQHPTNLLIHWICVPLIFWCVSGFLFLVTVPFFGNLAVLMLLAVTSYYYYLSKTLWVGMFIFGILCIAASFLLYARLYQDTLYFFICLFISAWLLQFYGHKIEGKKPSFLKDLQFLLIGPAWLMSKIYRSIGIQI